VTDERILSEIGILFVEGFETTGHTISWTLFNVATVAGGWLGRLPMVVGGGGEGGKRGAGMEADRCGVRSCM
jgi:hypothetical protein